VVSAAALARNLGGRRQGDNWRCSCPLECGYDLSLGEGDDGKLLAYCFGGCTFDDIYPALVEYGLLDDVDTRPIAIANGNAIRRREDAVERIAHARRLYDCSIADERVVTYLRSRGITLTSPVLRFSGHAPHRLGTRRSAMLAPVVDVNGEQVGTHLTFLRADSRGKADLDKRFQRECRGVIRGGAIRLVDHDPGRPLLIGEGIESTLSAMQLFGLPGWSAVYAGGLKTVELPPAIRSIVVATDHDVNGAGQRNALAAYERWTGQGRSVRLKIPPLRGDDFNDVLSKQRQG
jgi:putative DNA primase/helicase